MFWVVTAIFPGRLRTSVIPPNHASVWAVEDPIFALTDIENAAKTTDIFSRETDGQYLASKRTACGSQEGKTPNRGS